MLLEHEEVKTKSTHKLKKWSSLPDSVVELQFKTLFSIIFFIATLS